MELRRRRIGEAQRAGLRNRLRDQLHLPEVRADALLDEWTVRAAERGLTPSHAGFWQEGEEWIQEQVRKR